MMQFTKLPTLMCLSLISILTPLLINSTLYSLSFIMEMKISTIVSTPINLTLSLNQQNSLFFMMVTLITANILLFSSWYMHSDMFKHQFYKLLLLFVLSMMITILSGDLLLLFLGWDGLGMSSFLLVAHYSNFKSTSSALITLMSNRMGDATLVSSLAISISQSHLTMSLWSHNNLFIFLLISSAITKSAQMPFTVWLPEAMSAPTPVSALVHSSTLVTAGLFLLIQYSSPLYQSSYSCVLLYLSLTTSMIGGIMGALSKDLKKIVAMSTLSQLGLMISSLSLGLNNLAMFHLITHASFKALLFMTVGADIMMSSHSQSLNRNKKTSTMKTFSTSKLISLLSLMALPFTAGFFSKDMILELVETTEKIEPTICLLLATTSTSFYSLRIWKSSMISNPSPSLSSSMPQSPMFPFIILSLASISIGSLLSSMLLNSYQHPHHNYEHYLPIMSVLLGVLMSCNLNTTNPYFNSLSKSMLYLKPPTKKISIKTLMFSSLIINLSELSSIEGILPIMVKSQSKKTSNHLLLTQNMSLNKMMTLSILLMCLPTLLS